ncbi:MAG: fibronectin type III domain-containing protein [Candidatus Sumerlaeia bacterium]|nr:fibronectin type III domain-containing protein [Candidatus Sumerlaeia bacterium]
MKKFTLPGWVLATALIPSLTTGAPLVEWDDVSSRLTITAQSPGTVELSRTSEGYVRVNDAQPSPGGDVPSTEIVSIHFTGSDGDDHLNLSDAFRGNFSSNWSSLTDLNIQFGAGNDVFQVSAFMSSITSSIETVDIDGGGGLNRWIQEADGLVFRIDGDEFQYLSNSQFTFKNFQRFQADSNSLSIIDVWEIPTGGLILDLERAWNRLTFYNSATTGDVTVNMAEDGVLEPDNILRINKGEGGTLVLTETTAEWSDITVDINGDLDEVEINGSNQADEFIITPSQTAEITINGGQQTNLLRVELNPEDAATVNHGGPGAGEVLVDGFERISYSNMADVIVDGISTILNVGGVTLAGEQVLDLGGGEYTVTGPVLINGFLLATGDLSVDGNIIMGSGQNLELGDDPLQGNMVVYTGDFTINASGGTGDLDFVDPPTTVFYASQEPFHLCGGRVLADSMDVRGNIDVDVLENITFDQMELSPDSGISLEGARIHAGIDDPCNPSGGFTFRIITASTALEGFSVSESVALNMPNFPDASLTFGYMGEDDAFCSLEIPAGGILFTLPEATFPTDGVLSAPRVEGGPSGIDQPFITTGPVTLESSDTEVSIGEGTITAFDHKISFEMAAIQSGTGLFVEEGDLSTESSPVFGVLAGVVMDEDGVRAATGSSNLPNGWEVEFTDFLIAGNGLISTDNAMTILTGDRAILFEDFAPGAVGGGLYSGVRHRIGTGGDAFELELAAPLTFPGAHAESTTGTLTISTDELTTLSQVQIFEEETTLHSFELETKGFHFRGASSTEDDPHVTSEGIFAPVAPLFEDEKELSLTNVTFKPTDLGWEMTTWDAVHHAFGPFPSLRLLNARIEEGTPNRLAFDMEEFWDEETEAWFLIYEFGIDSAGDITLELYYNTPFVDGGNIEINFGMAQVIGETVQTDSATVMGLEHFPDSELMGARLLVDPDRGMIILFDEAIFSSPDWQLELGEGSFNGSFFSLEEGEYKLTSKDSPLLDETTGSDLTLNRTEVIFHDGQISIGPWTGNFVDGRIEEDGFLFSGFTATPPAISPIISMDLADITLESDGTGSFQSGQADFREKDDPEDDTLNIGFLSGTFTTSEYTFAEAYLTNIAGSPDFNLTNVFLDESSGMVEAGFIPGMPYEFSFTDGVLTNSGIQSTDVVIESGSRTYLPEDMSISSGGVEFGEFPFEFGAFSATGGGYIDGNEIRMADVPYDIPNVSNFYFTDLSIEDGGVLPGGATFEAGLLEVTASGTRFIQPAGPGVIRFGTGLLKYEDNEYTTTLVAIAPNEVRSGVGEINIGGKTFNYRNARFDGRGFFMPQLSTELFSADSTLEFRQVVLDGVRVAFETGWFELVGLEVNIPQSEFDPTPQGLLFTCDLVFPAAIGRPSFRIGLYITDSGVSLADLEFCTPHAPIKGSKFVFPILCFQYQAGPPEAFGGSGELTIPGLAGLAAGVLVRGGQVAEISIDMYPDPPTGRPLGSTGVFLRRISASIENLDRLTATVHTPDPPQAVTVFKMVTFKGDALFTAGPSFLSINLASGDLGLELSNSHIRMDGGMRILSFLQVSSGVLNVRWAGHETGFGARGYSYLAAILRGRMNVSYWDGSASGGGSFSVRIPRSVPVVGGFEVGSVGMRAQFTPNFSFRGTARVTIIPRFCLNFGFTRVCTPALRVSFGITVNQSGGISWSKEDEKLRDWEFSRTVPLADIAPDKVTEENKDVSITFLSNFSTTEKVYHKATFDKSTFETFAVNNPGVTIIRLAYEQDGGDPAHTLHLPDGTILDSEVLVFNPFAELDGDEGDEVPPGYNRHNPSARDASWFLVDAQPGVYHMELKNAASLGEYLIEVLSEIPEPIFEWDNVAFDGASILASFSGHDTGDNDTNISVGLASSMDDSDHYILADEIPGTGEIRSYEFPLSGRLIAPGRYFVFATIDNGITEPLTEFFPVPIHIVDPYAPLPPVNVSVSSIDGAALLTWDPSPTENVSSYRVDYTSDLTSLNYDRFQSAGDSGNSILIEDVEPGKTYRFAMRSIRGNRTDPMVRRAFLEEHRDQAVRDAFGETIVVESKAETAPMLLSAASNAVVLEMPFVPSTGLLTDGVDKSDAGLPPLFLTTPKDYAHPDIQYVYTPAFRTMDDLQPNLSLLEFPDGMTIDGSSVVWTPTSNVEDTWSTVTLRATDTEGRSSDQVFQVSLLNIQYIEPFAFSSTPPVLVEPGEEFVYHPTYSGDIFNLVPILTIIDGPEGMTAADGTVSWETSSGDTGTHLITIEANLYVEDESGVPLLDEIARQNFHLEIGDTDRHITEFFIGTTITELLGESLDSGFPAQLSSVATITAPRGSLPEDSDLFIIQDSSGPAGARGLLINDPDDLLGASPPSGRQLTLLTGMLETVDERPVFTLTEIEDNSILDDGSLPAPIRLIAGSPISSALEYVHVDMTNLQFLDDGTFQAGVAYDVDNGGAITTVMMLNSSPLIGEPIPTMPVNMRGIAWFEDEEGTWEIRVFDMETISTTSHGDHFFVQ